MQLAQAALNMNIDVYVASYDRQNQFHFLTSAWPEMRLQESGMKIENLAIEFSFIFSANHLAFVSREKGKSLHVLIQAAIHIVESPKRFYPDGIASYVNVYRNSIDFVITQHERMKELLIVFLELLVGFNASERILTSKLSVRDLDDSDFIQRRSMLREKLGIKENDIVIINAGGAWKWTYFNSFLKIFSVAVTKPETAHLFFIQPALGQSENQEHNDYHKETRALLSEMSPEQLSRIYIGDNWDDAALKLNDYLIAADYGLNLNENSLEQWQSYRVRTLEYFAAGLPVIISEGTFWDFEAFAESFLPVRNPEEDLPKVLREIASITTENSVYQNRKNEIRLIRSFLSLSNQAEQTIKNLINHPLRRQEPAISKAALWDFRNSGPTMRHQRPKFFGRKFYTSLQRHFARAYYAIVNNGLLHRVLVKVGIRSLVRFLRK